MRYLKVAFAAALAVASAQYCLVHVLLLCDVLRMCVVRSVLSVVECALCRL
jgi:hypothetical protein